MPEQKVVSGQKGLVVIWASTEAALRRKVRDAMRMPAFDVKKIMVAAKSYVETGNFPASKERFKSLEKVSDVFEFKSYQVRWLGIRDGKKFVVLHVVQKKSQRFAKKDIDKVKKEKGRYYDSEDRSS